MQIGNTSNRPNIVISSAELDRSRHFVFLISLVSRVFIPAHPGNYSGSQDSAFFLRLLFKHVNLAS